MSEDRSERLQREASDGDPDAADRLRREAHRHNALPPVEAALELARRSVEQAAPELLDDLVEVLGLRLDALQLGHFEALFEDDGWVDDFEHDPEATLAMLRDGFEAWTDPRVFSVSDLEQALEALREGEVIDGWEPDPTEAGWSWRADQGSAQVWLWWDEDDPSRPGWVWVEHEPETLERPVASLEALREAFEARRRGEAGDGAPAGS